MFSIKNLFKVLSFILVITLALYFAIDTIQNKQNIMSFEDYDPPSSLIVEGEVIKRAKYTFIDVPIKIIPDFFWKFVIATIEMT